jgi:hypothetical protein
MFQVGKISDKLYGIVGLDDSLDPTYAILDAGNQISRSGYRVTDNAYVKIEYIRDNQDYKNASELEFNAYVKRLQQSSIINVCNKVFNKFDYLDRNLLYTNVQNKVNQETLVDGFVGYEIEVDDDNDIAFGIKRVLLDFDTLGTFNLLLFNSNKSEPILQKTITITSKTQEVVLDWVIDNSDITYKGNYYLGYIKTATTPIPFKRDYQKAREMNNFSNLEIEKVQINGHNTETLFDLTLERGLYQDVGINPDITVYKDYTDLIINNEMLFARAIDLEFSIAILREQLNSMRDNINKRNSEDSIKLILAEIEGTGGNNAIRITGLRPTLMGEINFISKEIDKLSRGYFNDSIRVSTIT